MDEQKLGNYVEYFYCFAAFFNLEKEYVTALC